jgi:hypothetical protein
MQAARSVFNNKQAIVIGPTPPGTGVIAPATSSASAKLTSPTMRDLPSAGAWSPSSIHQVRHTESCCSPPEVGAEQSGSTRVVLTPARRFAITAMFQARLQLSEHNPAWPVRTHEDARSAGLRNRKLRRLPITACHEQSPRSARSRHAAVLLSLTGRYRGIAAGFAAAQAQCGRRPRENLALRHQRQSAAFRSLHLTGARELLCEEFSEIELPEFAAARISGLACCLSGHRPNGTPCPRRSTLTGCLKRLKKLLHRSYRSQGPDCDTTDPF